MSVASDDVGFARHCFANLFLLEKISRKAVRSHGPHVGGIYKSDRLFGGQSAAQFQLAFRRLFPRIVVQTLRVNYVAPGNLDDPIDYFFDPLPGTAFMMGRAVQKERIIASANIRYGPPNDLLDQSPYFMPSLRSPLSYGSVRERSLFLEDEAAKRTLQNLVKKSCLFDIRPVDFRQMFSHDVQKPRILWIRLGTLYRGLNCPKDGPTMVVMLSDCLVVHTARLHFEHIGKHNVIGGAASLNHTIWFHSFEDIDPDGWFLYETKCSRIANTSALVEGRIYDERGRCLATVLQEAYINAKL